MRDDRTNSAIQYSGEELLQFRNFVDNSSPSDNGDSPWLPAAVQPERRRRKTKRGSRAGLLVRLRKRENRPPLPSILLANVQSIENKLDELRSRIAFQRDIKNCNVFIFTETWLHSAISDSAIVPDGFTIFRPGSDCQIREKQGRWCVCHDKQ
ncbi:hypothetical protein OYC64_016119 [Pagothenia borchgrevinki]|uniref:Uncharacterized protein n=1 Tax=Pagothenia borchgrevinki TaxID=8213 RepID=A0ABD2HJH0_PAGBO